MRFISNRQVVATIIAASCVAVPASATASPDLSPGAGTSDAAQSGAGVSTLGSDAAQSGVNGWVASTDRTEAAQSAPAADSGTAATPFPPANFRGGDTKSDAPGAAGAPLAPTTIEVIRPERTIVRDVDEALPLILSGAALLLVLAGLAFTLLHGGMVPRARRSH